jgi:hypothetical protein
MTNKAHRIALLAAAFLLGAAGSGAAHARRGNHVTEFAGHRVHKAHAFPKTPESSYGGFAHDGRPTGPSFAVQFGYIAHPELASGSFGAMLQGRNPAPSGIP